MLQCPLGQFGDESTRLLVGLVQENVEQRDADAQPANHFDRLFIGLGRRQTQGFGALDQVLQGRLGDVARCRIRQRLDPLRHAVVVGQRKVQWRFGGWLGQNIRAGLNGRVK